MPNNQAPLLRILIDLVLLPWAIAFTVAAITTNNYFSMAYFGGMSVVLVLSLKEHLNAK